jgi:hypothetical protein
MPATHRAPISSSPAENPRPCQIRPCARPVGKVCWKRFRQTLAHLWHRARKQPWQPERSHPPALSPTTRAPQLSRHPLAFTCLRGPAGPERTKRVEHAPTCGHRLNNALGESERDLTAANGLWIGRLDPCSGSYRRSRAERFFAPSVTVEALLPLSCVPAHKLLAAVTALELWPRPGSGLSPNVRRPRQGQARGRAPVRKYRAAAAFAWQGSKT